jgi:hypothetical protein
MRLRCRHTLLLTFGKRRREGGGAVFCFMEEEVRIQYTGIKSWYTEWTFVYIQREREKERERECVCV